MGGMLPVGSSLTKRFIVLKSRQNVWSVLQRVAKENLPEVRHADIIGQRGGSGEGVHFGVFLCSGGADAR